MQIASDCLLAFPAAFLLRECVASVASVDTFDYIGAAHMLHKNISGCVVILNAIAWVPKSSNSLRSATVEHTGLATSKDMQ